MAKEETPLPGIRPGEGRSARYILEGGGASAMDELALTPEERRAVLEKRRKEEERREKERERMRARRDRIMVLDLSADLKEWLEQTAAREGVNVSSLATYLLYEGRAQVEAGRLNVERAKRVAGGGRYHYILVHPKDGRRSELTGEDAAPPEGGGTEDLGNSLDGWRNWGR